MKRSSVAATIIAVLLIGSFAFYQLRQRASSSSPSFTLIGEWRLDSAYAPGSTSDSIRQLTSLVYSGKEEDRMVYRFLADSTLKRESPKDDFSEKYYLQDSILYMLGDSTYIPYPFTKLSDSLLHFMNKDSVVFVLRKK
jgi:hypothetical protein